MKNPFRQLFLQLSFVLACSGVALGQAGVSSMSSSALSAGVALRHDDIRVEELINFHRHRIPLPGHDERIKLDARWWRVNDKKLAFQIGLATHRDIVKEFRTPLNLVLVIDRSGSMSGDRIEKVKEALLKLAGKLSERDLLSIVTYDSEAAICIEAANPSETGRVSSAISTIKSGGSTNLHGGLMLGYEVANRHHEEKRASRVILLTDGLANAGVVDHEVIARQSKTFNESGIDLSTIGLGNNFNHQLLRDLAEAGNGALHFIGGPEDVQKTFVDEFDSLLSPAAKDISITVQAIADSAAPKVFGYQPKAVKNGFLIESEDMNFGATQVIVGHFKSKRPVQISLTLEYFDSCTSKQVSVQKTLEIGIDEADEGSEAVRKNYTIAKLAAAIKSSAKQTELGNYRKAKKQLASAKSFARSWFAQGADIDVDRVFSIANSQSAFANAMVRQKISASLGR